MNHLHGSLSMQNSKEPDLWPLESYSQHHLFVQTNFQQFIKCKGISNYALRKILLNDALKFSELYLEMHH